MFIIVKISNTAEEPVYLDRIKTTLGRNIRWVFTDATIIVGEFKEDVEATLFHILKILRKADKWRPAIAQVLLSTSSYVDMTTDNSGSIVDITPMLP